MRAARLHGIGDIRVSDEPRTEAGPETSLVRVAAVGLCGSDLHWFGEGGIGDAGLVQPLVLGHEFAGVVEGGELDGRRVAVDPAIPCLSCRECFEGNHNLCTRIRFAGHGRQDGGLREYVAWPTRLLHPLPDVISDAGGAMLEPLGVAIHAHDLGHVRAGTSVAVVGCGPIGLLLIQVARAAGATTIVAVDPLPHRQRAAKRYGADVVVASASADEVDVTFEVAGNDDAVHTSMQLVRPGGRVVLAGIPDSDATTFPASLARRKGLTLTLVRRMKATYPRAIQLVERGLVDVESLVTARYPLDQTAEAFASASAREGLKVVIQ